MTPSKTQNVQPFPIDEDLHPCKHDPIRFVGSPRFSHLRYELRRLLSALTLLQAWSSFPGQPWPTNPVHEGQKGAEPCSATPTGGHRGLAPSLFFGLISPPREGLHAHSLLRPHGPCHTHTERPWHCLLSSFHLGVQEVTPGGRRAGPPGSSGGSRSTSAGSAGGVPLPPAEGCAGSCVVQAC